MAKCLRGFFFIADIKSTISDSAAIFILKEPDVQKSSSSDYD